jgi:phospholipid transport system substrate-binding protein
MGVTRTNNDHGMRDEHPRSVRSLQLAWLLSIVYALGALLLCCASSFVAAAESPLAVIRATVEQVMAVLQDSAYQGAAHRQERFTKVRELVLPRFDTQEMAKRTLGVHWRTRTAAEQAEFTQLFTDLVEKSYRQTLDRYTHDAKVTYEQERIETPFAEVDTHLFSPIVNEPIAITYRLHTVGDQWLIYDMVIANVSMVRNYRAQFDRVLGKSGYQELIDTIKRKLRELDEPPRSTGNT